MFCNINIGPVSGNPETEMTIAFGDNVIASRVIDYVKKSAHIRETYGLISNLEASEMIKQTEEKLKQLNMV